MEKLLADLAVTEPRLAAQYEFLLALCRSLPMFDDEDDDLVTDVDHRQTLELLHREVTAGRARMVSHRAKPSGTGGWLGLFSSLSPVGPATPALYLWGKAGSNTDANNIAKGVDAAASMTLKGSGMVGSALQWVSTQIEEVSANMDDEYSMVSELSLETIDCVKSGDLNDYAGHIQFALGLAIMVQFMSFVYEKRNGIPVLGLSKRVLNRVLSCLDRIGKANAVASAMWASQIPWMRTNQNMLFLAAPAYLSAKFMQDPKGFTLGALTIVNSSRFGSLYQNARGWWTGPSKEQVEATEREKTRRRRLAVRSRERVELARIEANRQMMVGVALLASQDPAKMVQYLANGGTTAGYQLALTAGDTKEADAEPEPVPVLSNIFTAPARKRDPVKVSKSWPREIVILEEEEETKVTDIPVMASAGRPLPPGKTEEQVKQVFDEENGHEEDYREFREVFFPKTHASPIAPLVKRYYKLKKIPLQAGESFEQLVDAFRESGDGIRDGKRAYDNILDANEKVYNQVLEEFIENRPSIVAPSDSPVRAEAETEPLEDDLPELDTGSPPVVVEDDDGEEDDAPAPGDLDEKSKDAPEAASKKREPETKPEDKPGFFRRYILPTALGGVKAEPSVKAKPEPKVEPGALVSSETTLASLVKPEPDARALVLVEPGSKTVTVPAPPAIQYHRDDKDLAKLKDQMSVFSSVYSESVLSDLSLQRAPAEVLQFVCDSLANELYFSMHELVGIHYPTNAKAERVDNDGYLQTLFDEAETFFAWQTEQTRADAKNAVRWHAFAIATAAYLRDRLTDSKNLAETSGAIMTLHRLASSLSFARRKLLIQRRLEQEWRVAKVVDGLWSELSLVAKWTQFAEATLESAEQNDLILHLQLMKSALEETGTISSVLAQNGVLIDGKNLKASEVGYLMDTRKHVENQIHLLRQWIRGERPSARELADNKDFRPRHQPQNAVPIQTTPDTVDPRFRDKTDFGSRFTTLLKVDGFDSFLDLPWEVLHWMSVWYNASIRQAWLDDVQIPIKFIGREPVSKDYPGLQLTAIAQAYKRNLVTSEDATLAWGEMTKKAQLLLPCVPRDYVVISLDSQLALQQFAQRVRDRNRKGDGNESWRCYIFWIGNKDQKSTLLATRRKEFEAAFKGLEQFVDTGVAFALEDTDQLNAMLSTAMAFQLAHIQPQYHYILDHRKSANFEAWVKTMEAEVAKFLEATTFAPLERLTARLPIRVSNETTELRVARGSTRFDVNARVKLSAAI